jgi:DNA polymerase
VLFVAEAPGHSEDGIGYPLVGPAGHLFDEIVKRAVPPEVRCGFCNLVACIPLNEMRTKTEEPPVEAITECAPRLIQLIGISQPRLIVCVGTKATEWLDRKWKMAVINEAPEWIKSIPQESLVHPSHILQAPKATQGLAKQKMMVTLADAVEEYVLEKRNKEGRDQVISKQWTVE